MKGESTLEEIKKETSAATEAKKSFTEQFTHGSKVKLQMSIQITDFSLKDCREILGFLSSSARNFYLKVAKKININNTL